MKLKDEPFFFSWLNDPTGCSSFHRGGSGSVEPGRVFLPVGLSASAAVMKSAVEKPSMWVGGGSGLLISWAGPPATDPSTMKFCKVLLCSAALVLLAGSVESSSGGEAPSEPLRRLQPDWLTVFSPTGSTGPLSYDLSGSDLTKLYNKRVHLAEAMRRPLENFPFRLGYISHCGVWWEKLKSADKWKH